MNNLVETQETLEENNDLLWQVLDRTYFQHFRDKEKYNKSKIKTIELFIKGKCPSNCTYCYLAKHGKELYPLECQSNENILKNLDIFLEWYVRNKFICMIEMFSGECIVEGLMFQIWDRMYNVLSKVDLEYRPRAILQPDNMDFCEYPDLIQKVQEYVDKFADIGIVLSFSASVDGKYMDDNRTRVRSKDFYPNLFKFLLKNDFGVHPMVAAAGIERWSQNYDWWKSNEVPKRISDRFMALEVRNDEWTEDKIQGYLDFLNHVIENEFKNVHNGDLESFTRRVFQRDDYPTKGYDNIVLNYQTPSTFSGLSCSGQSSFMIRLGDLGIGFCHRLSYDKFLTGYLTVDENNRINGVRAKNVPFFVGCLCWDKNSAPQCSECDYKPMCPGPCLGANYEAMSTPFLTPVSVCNLFKAKTTFLIMKYEEMGVFDKFEELYPHDEVLARYRKFMKKLEGGINHYELRPCGRITDREVDEEFRRMAEE